MNRKTSWTLAGALLVVVFLSPWLAQALPRGNRSIPIPQSQNMMGPGMMGGGMMMGQGMMGGNPWMRIHMQAMHTLPPEYRGLKNPLKPTKENILAGGQLYQQTCAVCHGPTGRGDGPGGKTLNPPPAPLALTVPMPMTTDGYLFWRIKEGGQAFGTAMPAWGASLSEEQIWQIILYLRAGFPEIPQNAPSDTSQSSNGPQE